MALGDPERPFVAILGGAKVSDKIEVIESLLGRVDRLLIGGAMAYTFFKAQGMPVGKSLVEDDKLDAARDIMRTRKARGCRARAAGRSRRRRQARRGAPRPRCLKVERCRDRRPDGRSTSARRRRGCYAALLADAKTVVWNGPMGVFEIGAVRARARSAVAHAVADEKGTTIIGGGDSVAAVNEGRRRRKITHISTGGGASLEFLGGQAARRRGVAGQAVRSTVDSRRSSTRARGLGRAVRSAIGPLGPRVRVRSTDAPTPHRRQLEDVQDRAETMLSVKELRELSVKTSRDVDIVVAPPFTAVHAVAEARARLASRGRRAEHALGARRRVHRRGERGR